MKQIVFLINLTQDVAVCRSVAFFARREFDLPLTLVVSDTFRKRDITGVWFNELNEIVADTKAEVLQATTTLDVMKFLHGKSGMLIACSESALNAHTFCHTVFLSAPPSFTKITLQHGLECIGFNHNAAHDRAWQNYVGMACDIAASWFEPEALHSVRPDQKAKIMAVGPQIGLDQPMPSAFMRPRRPRTRTIHGLVCENLHSVRFNSDEKLSFTKTLQKFAEDINNQGGFIDLRPHPGGQYLYKKPVSLPSNVSINNLPLYKQALERFSFGISSPSSVLIDMIWAGIPVAVWTQGNLSHDIGAYEGLHVVSSVSDWLEFARMATENPGIFIDIQTKYLETLRIPRDIPQAYRSLIATAMGL